MTHTTDLYAYIWAGVRLPVAILVAVISGWLFVLVWRGRHEALPVAGHHRRPAVRPITEQEKRVEAARIDEERTAALWGQRVTPLDHDALRYMPMAAPRRYVGRAEVVFPDAVVADVVPVDWVHYLYDAATWEQEMRALVGAS